MVAAGRQVVEELLDARLVRHRGPRVLLAPVALGRVLAVRAVHLVEPLGLRVVRLEVVVAHRPRRRQPVDVVQLAEVPRPQPVQRRAVQLRGTTDVVVDLRLERGAVASYQVSSDMYRPSMNTAPGSQFAISRGRKLPRSSSRIFLPAGRERVGERASAGTGPDDDDVVVVGAHGGCSPCRCGSPAATGGASDRCDAETIRPRWENACGKLPISRFVVGVVLLGQHADVVLQAPQLLEQREGLVAPADEREVVHQPERGHEERALTGGEPVDAVVVRGRVAQDEAVHHQLALDRLDGADDPRVGRREEADTRQHQQAGVELVGAVVLHEAVLLGVEALLADLGLDLVGERRATSRSADPCARAARTSSRPGRTRPTPSPSTG